MRKLALLVLLLPLLAACLKDEYVDYTAIDEQIISEYLSTHNIDAERHASGLYYKIIDPGTGTPIGDNPSEDEKVTFSYKMYLTTKDEPVIDTEGNNITGYLSGLLFGFQIGLPQVNREGEIDLYMPSALAFGAGGGNGIPPNSVVIFKVKMDRDQDDIDEDIIAAYLRDNSIDAQHDDSGLYYQILKEGEGDNIHEHAYVDIKYTGTILESGKVFEEGELDRAPFQRLIEAWRNGLPKLKKGSKAVLYCPSQQCYGSSTRYDDKGEVKIPSNSILIFQIEVLDFI
ncbi:MULTISPECIES: FKBP-type peptidyl-prolyl cis-trans isomerase [unclassified Carboxylicivirga]|uniref:FKBP-type peptidyl-prolyl cis-trans isomerase n=1 Tax=Carboxylicivirga TaxID=1628153 RepID=UPI003D347D78